MIDLFGALDPARAESHQLGRLPQIVPNKHPRYLVVEKLLVWGVDPSGEIEMLQDHPQSLSVSMVVQLLLNVLLIAVEALD